MTDFQGMVAARGLMQKVEQHIFPKETETTRREKWDMIAAGTLAPGLGESMKKCGLKYPEKRVWLQWKTGVQDIHS